MIEEWLHINHFAYPWLLPLLVLIPFLILWYAKNYTKQTAALTVTTTHFLKQTINWRTRLKHLPFILRMIALSFLIIALARPQNKFNTEQTDGEGIDMVLCFDISGSMMEKDFLPNRLEAAKEVAAQFVTSRPGDRIGVTIFSSLSFTLCPVTTDHNAVINQIKNIQSGLLQEEGTAIGSGIATSVDRLRNSTSKTKIIILLTDGVDFGGKVSPDIGKEMAKLYGIKIYTIGIGSNVEMELPTQTPFGEVKQKRKLDYNENLLKSIAEETGGLYFQAGDKEKLKTIYANIDTLEKSKITITKQELFSDKYFLFLAIGLAIIIVELALRLTALKKYP